MTRKKPITTRLKITLTEQQSINLAELLATGLWISESEIFRVALNQFHRKQDPPYLKPTPAGEAKIEKAKKEKAFRAIPDEQYVAENLKYVHIHTDEAGVKWLLAQKQGNYVEAMKLDQVKDWVKNEDFTYLWHMQNAYERPEFFTDYLTGIYPIEVGQREIFRELGMVISEPTGSPIAE